MKAAVLYGTQDLRIEDRDPPDSCPEDSVLLKVKACGICGSDIPRYFQGKARRYPIILGHEFSGEILDFDPKIMDLAKGDHCVGIPLIPCGKCNACLSGNYALCSNYSFLGSRCDGAMQEIIALPRRNVFRVDKKIPYDKAAFFEVATVALHAIKRVKVLSDMKVAIFGSGVVGLLILQWLLIHGVNNVVVFGRNEKTLHTAMELGAKDTINIKETCLVEHYECYDNVFEASGSEDGLKISLMLTNILSSICLVGTYPNEIHFSSREWWQINKKELNLTGSWMGYSSGFPGTEWVETDKAISNNILNLDPLIYKRFPLNSAVKAFDEFKAHKVCGRIILLT